MALEICLQFDFGSVSPDRPENESDFYEGELLALRPPPLMTVSEWADANRILQQAGGLVKI